MSQSGDEQRLGSGLSLPHNRDFSEPLFPGVAASESPGGDFKTPKAVDVSGPGGAASGVLQAPQGLPRAAGARCLAGGQGQHLGSGQTPSAGIPSRPLDCFMTPRSSKLFSVTA